TRGTATGPDAAPSVRRDGKSEDIRARCRQLPHLAVSSWLVAAPRNQRTECAENGRHLGESSLGIHENSACKSASHGATTTANQNPEYRPRICTGYRRHQWG